MDFSITTDQEDLRTSIRQIMHAEASQAVLIERQGALTGYVPAIWEQLSRGGWHGILIPEAYGGTGAPLPDACLVFEEYGAGPLPHLYFTCAAVSPLLIQELGSPGQLSRLLPSLADGSYRVTAAIPEIRTSWTGTDFETTLTRDADGFRLSGEKMYVPDALGATHALVTARAEDGTTALVLADLASGGCTSELLDGFTSWENRVTFDSVPVDTDNIIGGPGTDAAPGIRRAILRAIPALCSYQVGSSQAVFDLALSHSKTRIQFERPVGRFQRVQDHIIELANHLDSARWATYEAIWKSESDSLTLDASLHMTKALVAESHWEACNCAHEVHAGLGADLQYGLAKHTYLSHALYHYLGSPGWHRNQLASALGW